MTISMSSTEDLFALNFVYPKQKMNLILLKRRRNDEWLRLRSNFDRGLDTMLFLVSGTTRMHHLNFSRGKLWLLTGIPWEMQDCKSQTDFFFYHIFTTEQTHGNLQHWSPHHCGQLQTWCPFCDRSWSPSRKKKHIKKITGFNLNYSD